MNDTSKAGADLEADLREITSPAGKLRYYDHGNGPALLFLHGSGPGVTGWRNFRGVLPAFAKQFRCLILEFPGFGVSDDFGGHPMVDAQSSVAPFLDAIGVDRVDIVGNSMGGGVGINFAIHHADRVGKLVTIGGIGTNIFSPGPSEGIRLLQEFTEDPTRQRLVDWLNSMVYNQQARHGRTHRGALETSDGSRDAGFRPPDVRQGGIRSDDVDDEDVRHSDAVVADA